MARHVLATTVFAVFATAAVGLFLVLLKRDIDVMRADPVAHAKSQGWQACAGT